MFRHEIRKPRFTTEAFCFHKNEVQNSKHVLRLAQLRHANFTGPRPDKHLPDTWEHIIRKYRPNFENGTDMKDISIKRESSRDGFLSGSGGRTKSDDA